MSGLVEIRPEHAAALRRAIEATGVRVVTPDAPERALILDVLALARIVGKGWPVEHARRYVSLTLPALPQPLPALLTLGGVALSPYTALGAEGLRALATLTERPTISLSPASLESPAETVAVLLHEWQHVLQGEAGGVLHPIVYLARSDERVLACEAPAYGATLAVEHWTRGVDPLERAAQLAEGLRAYGATDALVADARAILQSHARALLDGLCPPVEALLRGLRALDAAGVRGLPAVPA